MDTEEAIIMHDCEHSQLGRILVFQKCSVQAFKNFSPPPFFFRFSLLKLL